jgi:23S rRNA pseudouridine2605 synthase
MSLDNTRPGPAPTSQKNTAEGERLQNVLSHRGVASRRHAADMIANGEVTVNGTLITEPGFRVNPDADDVRVRGERLQRETEHLRTVLLYKPQGLICAADNTQGETVCDLMRQHMPERLVPVGRLDKESEGLLLMSNDGDLTQILTHPRYGHTKTYIARVAGHMEDRKIELLRSRMEIDGYFIQPVEVEVLKVGKDHTHKLAFTLTEGRNRQIRKMCSLASFVVLSLTRVRIGPLKICNMQPGEWRELTDVEIRSLKRPISDPPARLPDPRPQDRDARPSLPRYGDRSPTPKRPPRADGPSDHPAAPAPRPQDRDNRPSQPRYGDRPTAPHRAPRADGPSDRPARAPAPRPQDRDNRPSQPRYGDRPTAPHRASRADGPSDRHRPR